MRMVGCSNSGPDRPNLKVFEQQVVMSKAISSEQKSKFVAIHRNGDASVSKKKLSRATKNKTKFKYVGCTNGDLHFAPIMILYIPS